MPSSGKQAPERLGRYELLARLGRGGMGEIFLARLEGAAGFEKLFVIKRILPHLADDPRLRHMLVAEAQIAAKMAHANICHVYELGETNGELYIVMEHLEGVTLLAVLRKLHKQRAMLDLGFVAGVVSQTCDALHYAHELSNRGGAPISVVHRDVSPANIFLTQIGVAKVLDFGIAKIDNASTQTETGVIKGKNGYMAPEQLRGASVDRRADIFALGVVLFEMLALHRLFQRKTDYLTFQAVMEQPIPSVRRYRPEITESVAQVVARALERDPQLRWDSARQLGAALADAIAPVRPWSHTEIGDFVRHHFATELAEQGQQLELAVHHRGAAIHDFGPPAGNRAGRGVDDSDIPWIDLDQVPELRAGRSSTSGLSPVFDTLPPRLSSRFAAVPPRRSPLLPIAIFALTAAAAITGWILWRSAAEQDRVASAPPPQIDERPYRELLFAQQAALTACVAQHGGNASLPADAFAIVAIDDRGRPSVSFTPTSVDASPLGACLRGVIAGVEFPKRDYLLRARLK